MEPQELSIRNRIPEEMARSELEAMDRDARYALLYQDQKSTQLSENNKDKQEVPSVML